MKTIIFSAVVLLFSTSSFAEFKRGYSGTGEAAQLPELPTVRVVLSKNILDILTRIGEQPAAFKLKIEDKPFSYDSARKHETN